MRKASVVGNIRSTSCVGVGSWTYGRAEIAIVTPEAVGLAAISLV
jgi:hypothetical protein